MVTVRTLFGATLIVIAFAMGGLYKASMNRQQTMAEARQALLESGCEMAELMHQPYPEEDREACERMAADRR